jgi:hypothetical protein
LVEDRGGAGFILKAGMLTGLIGGRILFSALGPQCAGGLLGIDKRSTAPYQDPANTHRGALGTDSIGFDAIAVFFSCDGRFQRPASFIEFSEGARRG